MIGASIIWMRYLQYVVTIKCMAVILFFTAACQNLNPVSNSALPDGRLIKSIEVYYNDKFGDQPQRDGELIAFVHFNNSGYIESIKEGLNGFVSNNNQNLTLVYDLKSYTQQNTVWLLDGLTLRGNENILSIGIKNWPEEELKNFIKNHSAERTLPIPDRPLSFCS